MRLTRLTHAMRWVSRPWPSPQAAYTMRHAASSMQQWTSANIDLKGFTGDLYVKLTGGYLQSVLNTLAYVHHNTDCWLEINALLIPGRKDSKAKIKALRTCMTNELGSEVLLHCSAFHPEMRNKKLPDVSENSKKPFGSHQIPAYMRAEQS